MSCTLNGEPAYFFGAPRVDPRAQGFGDDLGAEADSKHGLVPGYGLANERDLWTKPAEPSLVIRTHRAAHDRQHLEIGKRRQRGIAVQVELTERNPRAAAQSVTAAGPSHSTCCRTAMRIMIGPPAVYIPGHQAAEPRQTAAPYHPANR